MAESVERRAEAEEGLDWVEVPIPLPPPGETTGFEAGGLALLLCNAEGTAYVVKDECPHVRVSMKGGRIRGTLLECPLHGGLLDLRDGSPAGLPIRRPGRCYPVRSDAGTLRVGLPAD